MSFDRTTKDASAGTVIVDATLNATPALTNSTVISAAAVPSMLATNSVLILNTLLLEAGLATMFELTVVTFSTAVLPRITDTLTILGAAITLSSYPKTIAIAIALPVVAALLAVAKAAIAIVCAEFACVKAATPVFAAVLA